VAEVITALTLVSPAAALAVSLSDAKAHLRVVDSAEDGVIGIYLAAAIQAVQDHTGRALITETWRLALPGFPSGDLVLPRAPLGAVSEVRYWTDAAAPVDTLLAATVYQVLSPSDPTAPEGRLRLGASQSWPAAQPDRADAVRITYTAGYGTTSASVPAPLRAAVLLLTGDLYENREAGGAKVLAENPAVQRLLSPYRIWPV
jgi:uncharacterized phiE125 gp8 family phage protein